MACFPTCRRNMAGAVKWCNESLGSVSRRDRSLLCEQMPVATRTRSDIDRQRQHDAGRQQNLGLLGVRVRAIAEAQRAVGEREEGAVPALRQSIIDLAAVCEALADDLAPAS